MPRQRLKPRHRESKASFEFVLEDFTDEQRVGMLDSIDTISEKYLTSVEANLIYLMKLNRRPVEISRILKIPECEVVRLRRNCFRKIRTIFLYEFDRDKKEFVTYVIELLSLNEKQQRILSMFFDYYGLRPIAEVIGTRPSNVHRSLESMKAKLLKRITVNSPDRFFVNAFDDFKYLNVSHNVPEEVIV